MVSGPHLTLRYFFWFSQHFEIFFVGKIWITNSVFKKDTGLFKFVLVSVFLSCFLVSLLISSQLLTILV